MTWELKVGFLNDLENPSEIVYIQKTGLITVNNPHTQYSTHIVHRSISLRVPPQAPRSYRVDATNTTTTPFVWQALWDKNTAHKWSRWWRTKPKKEIDAPLEESLNFGEHDWDERSEMLFLNDLTNPPETSLHLKNRPALTLNVDDGQTWCSRSARSTTSQQAASAVLHEGL